MSRYIDSIPEPKRTRDLKLVMLGFSRSGTLGVFNACNLLGYRAYHTLEMLRNGIRDLKISNEALAAGLLGQGEPFTRKEYDKWLAEYDVIIELPAYMPLSVIASYPSTQFLLVQRDPDALARSWESTVFQYADGINSFPMSILKHFDPFLRELDQFTNNLVSGVTYGQGASSKREVALKEYYMKYLEQVKRLLPPKRLHIVKLEEGLGWEQLCPILGEKIPDIPWPKIHSPEEFKRTLAPHMEPAVKSAFLRLFAILLPFIGVLLWFLVKI